MKALGWPGALLYRVGVGCRRCAAFCGTLPRSKRLKRARVLQQDLDSCLQEDGWSTSDGEHNKPDSPHSLEVQSSDPDSMSINLSEKEVASKHEVAVLDGHMRDLRGKLETLVVELQSTIVERNRLLESPGTAECPQTSIDNELLHMIRNLGTSASGSLDLSGDSPIPSPESEIHSSWGKNAILGHSRQSSNTNPESEPITNDDGDSRVLVRFNNLSAECADLDNEIVLDQMEMGNGEFVVDDEIDGISDCIFSNGQLVDDLPTPRAFLSSNAFGSDYFLQGEDEEKEAIDEAEDCEITSFIEDPVDQSIEVRNPPFAPMETQVPRPTTTWDDSVSCDVFDEEDPCTWLSNTTFGSTSNGSQELLDREQKSHIHFRTTHEALVEQANQATHLLNELRQTQLTLEDTQSQLDFTTERMISYKKSLQAEQVNKAVAAAKHKLELDEATSSKFIMFCRLQELQTRVKELEEKQDPSHKLAERSLKSFPDQIENSGSKSGKDREFSGPPDICLSQSNLPLRHSDSMPVSRGSGYAYTSSAAQRDLCGNNHPLHEALSRTMRSLLDAEARGDALQKQVDNLRNQKPGVSEPSTSPLPESFDSKKARTDFKRMKAKLQKLESDLEASNSTKHQQDKELLRLRSEITTLKRGSAKGQAPRWR